jgi:hypothetical protein
MIIFVDVDFFRDVIDFGNSDLTGLFEPISNFEGVDAFIKKLLCLFKKSSSKDNYTCSSIPDFVVLGFREFDKKICDFMLDLIIKYGANMLTSIFSRMVAPSLVTITSPSGLTKIKTM